MNVCVLSEFQSGSSHIWCGDVACYHNEIFAPQYNANLCNSMFSQQVALVDMLRAVGVEPDGMLGHSVGEIGCGYADGGLTAEQTLLYAYWRGRCVELGDVPKGAMAAVGKINVILYVALEYLQRCVHPCTSFATYTVDNSTCS